jgi:hypothetical protein
MGSFIWSGIDGPTGCFFLSVRRTYGRCPWRSHFCHLVLSGVTCIVSTRPRWLWENRVDWRSFWALDVYLKFHTNPDYINLPLTIFATRVNHSFWVPNCPLNCMIYRFVLSLLDLAKSIAIEQYVLR